MIDKMEKDLEDRSLIEVLLRHLPEEALENPQSEQPISRKRFERSTS
jgi:hypothetical protein